MHRLPVHLRAALAVPFGPIADTEGALRAAHGKLLVTVGDVVTRTFLSARVVPKLMVVDGVTKRGTVVDDALDALPDDVVRVDVVNPAAEITTGLFDAVREGLARDGNTLIEVRGEEDLAALPAMTLAPDGALVAYGQPDRGVVLVTVTPEVRKRAEEFLHQMEVE